LFNGSQLDLEALASADLALAPQEYQNIAVPAKACLRIGQRASRSRGESILLTPFR
jgi:hypothetical protein